MKIFLNGLFRKGGITLEESHVLGGIEREIAENESRIRQMLSLAEPVLQSRMRERSLSQTASSASVWSHLELHNYAFNKAWTNSIFRQNHTELMMRLSNLYAAQQHLQELESTYLLEATNLSSDTYPDQPAAAASGNAKLRSLFLECKRILQHLHEMKSHVRALGTGRAAVN